MRRAPVVMSRTAIVLSSTFLALAVLPGIASSQPETDPPAAEPSAPAQPGLCPADTLCAWPEPSYEGSVTEIGDARAAGCRELSRPAVSAINDSGRTAVFYAASGCVGGVVIGVEPGRKAPKFAEAASIRLRQPGTGSVGADTPADTPADKPADEPADAPADEATEPAP